MENKRTIIFVTDLTLWSMGNGNGGPAFTQTVNKYIQEGCEVWLISDVEANRNCESIPYKQNIVLHESKYKKNIFKRYTGVVYRFLDHISTTKEFVYAINEIIVKGLCNKDNTILYAYEVFGVKACHIVSKKTQIPVVTRFQGTILSKYRNNVFNRIRIYPHFQAISQDANAVIMTDDGTQGDIVLSRLHNESKNILFLRNGLDLLEINVEDLIRQFDRNSFRTKVYSHMKEDDMMFLTVSRLVKWKHVDRAIRGFADFQRNGGNGCLVIVGEGDDRQFLESLAKDLGVSEKVFFVGAVSHRDVYDYMMACDVFLSLYDLSNVGNPLLEAMTLGKCIITLNVGDTFKVIVNRENGILLNSNELDALGNIMIEVASDTRLRNDLANRAARYARENFCSWEKRMDKEFTVVSSLTPNSGGGV